MKRPDRWGVRSTGSGARADPSQGLRGPQPSAGGRRRPVDEASSTSTGPCPPPRAGAPNGGAGNHRLGVHARSTHPASGAAPRQVRRPFPLRGPDPSSASRPRHTSRPTIAWAPPGQVGPIERTVGDSRDRQVRRERRVTTTAEAGPVHARQAGGVAESLVSLGRPGPGGSLRPTRVPDRTAPDPAAPDPAAPRSRCPPIPPPPDPAAPRPRRPRPRWVSGPAGREPAWVHDVSAATSRQPASGCAAGSRGRPPLHVLGPHPTEGKRRADPPCRAAGSPWSLTHDRTRAMAGSPAGLTGPEWARGWTRSGYPSSSLPRRASRFRHVMVRTPRSAL
jgi:hypothetical protein